MCPFVPTLNRWLPALAVAGLALAADAQQPSAARQSAGIQFTEPSSPVVSTNQSEPKDKLPDLRGLNSSVRKPFELFNAGDSFSGAMAPPPVRRAPPSAADAKRMKEALDRKKNWAFLTPEEIYGVKSPDEMLDGPDGEPKEAKTSIERYIERMENARVSAVSNQMNSDSLAAFTNPDGETENSEDGANERKVLGFLSESHGQIPSALATTPGVLGFNQSFISPEVMAEKNSAGVFGNIGQPAPAGNPFARSPAQEASMKEFKALLESRSSPSPAFNSGFDGLPRVSPASVQPFSLAEPARISGAAQAVRSPLSAPTTLGVALPSYTPAYSPPPTPAPRFAPPAATFELPTRKF